MPGANVGQLCNFTAGLRKLALIPFGYFSPGDSISWIVAVPASGTQLITAALSGTVDGANAIFTIPGTITQNCFVYKNGILQTIATMYTLSGQVVTFLYPYIPQPGDVLEAITN